MRNSHIFLKLFIIITVFLSLFIGLILLFQTRYFGTYYLNNKEDNFTTVFHETVAAINNSNDTENGLFVKLKTLYSEYECFAALYPDGNGSINEDNIKEILADGIFIEGMTNIFEVPNREITQLLLNNAEFSEPMIKTIQSDENGMKYLIAMQSVEINEKSYVFSMAASLQSIDEAMGTLNEISWLAYVIAILTSLLLSAVIAKLVAKPLIREIERKKELDDMRRDFIANTSHEMKTPISLISLYAESMKDGLLSPEERSECETAIYHECQKMGKLVRDMMEIAMMQSESHVLEKEVTRLDELVSNTVSRLDMQIKQKHIVVETDRLAPTEIPVDADMIENVFVNLMANAISHTPEQGKIRIALKEQGSKIRFEIENEGLPIPTEAIPYIWESFYRVDKARNREDGRFGLGLFAVKTIIEKHKGTVGVNNKEGSVVFYFEIPK